MYSHIKATNAAPRLGDDGERKHIAEIRTLERCASPGLERGRQACPATLAQRQRQSIDTGNATGAPPPPSSTYRNCLVAIFRAGKQELALGNAIMIARADQILVEFNELRIVSKTQPLLIGDKRARRFLTPPTPQVPIRRANRDFRRDRRRRRRLARLDESAPLAWEPERPFAHKTDRGWTRSTRESRRPATCLARWQRTLR